MGRWRSNRKGKEKGLAEEKNNKGKWAGGGKQNKGRKDKEEKREKKEEKKINSFLLLERRNKLC